MGAEQTQLKTPETQVAQAEVLDVVIVGAGLSGIGAGCHIRRKLPHYRFRILEARARMGGTWDLFRYPGIRSDSDMFTLGYRFKVWQGKDAIAEGSDIRAYIEDAAREYQLEQHIRYQHRLSSMNWNSQQGYWELQVDSPEGQLQLRSRFVIGATGYYSYDKPYRPHFPGEENFKGEIIHPQHWPDDLDCSGKRVVVIGSGATAITLGPALAKRGAEVSMLQRSPSYVMSLPRASGPLNLVRKLLPGRIGYALSRGIRVSLAALMFQLSRRRPEMIRKGLHQGIREFLGEDYDMRHFSPSYQPWDERLCLVPDGDLFEAIRDGDIRMVTNTISCFDEHGIQLDSGERLDADVIISATGLNAKIFDHIALHIDGERKNLPDCTVYKGVLAEGIPNLGMLFGYTNASWTLKADLCCDYLCRLYKHIDNKKLRSVTPSLEGHSMEKMPFIDLQSGYVKRAADQMPWQGDRIPWRLYQNYFLDLIMLRLAPLRDRFLQFRR